MEILGCQEHQKCETSAENPALERDSVLNAKRGCLSRLQFTPSHVPQASIKVKGLDVLLAVLSYFCLLPMR